MESKKRELKLEREGGRERENKRRKKKLYILFCADSDFDHVIRYGIEKKEREKRNSRSYKTYCSIIITTEIACNCNISILFIINNFEFFKQFF